MKSRENEINLLPNDYIKAKQRFWIRQIVGVLLVVEVALFIWGIVVPSKQKVQSLQIELEVSRQQMNISGFEQVDKVTSQLEEMEKQLQEWNICHSLLERENMIQVSVLDALTANIPQGVFLNKMSLQPAKFDEREAKTSMIFIEGSSENLEEYLNYLSIIELLYSPINVDNSCSSNQGIYHFTITIRVPVEFISQEEIVAEPIESIQTEEEIIHDEFQ